MRIYFSGGSGLKTTPEALIPERKPHIMLTFHDIENNGTMDRLNVYLERVTGRKLQRRKQPKNENKKRRVSKRSDRDEGRA